jgi:hypothetical protein
MPRLANADEGFLPIAEKFGFINSHDSMLEMPWHKKQLAR